MRQYRFSIEKTYLGGTSNVAYVNEGEHILDELTYQVLDDIGTDLLVTVSDVTMPLAFWRDPAHWAEDIRADHSDGEDPEEFVAGLLKRAREDQ